MAPKIRFVSRFISRRETFIRKNRLNLLMNSTQKLAVGFGIASGALLTALLMSGGRARKTRNYLVRSVRHFRASSRTMGRKAEGVDEPEVHYI